MQRCTSKKKKNQILTDGERIKATARSSALKVKKASEGQCSVLEAAWL